MRKSELEKLVKEQGEKIKELGIIPKSREIAEKLGECKYVSEKWATANYMFVNESLRIDYQVYAMGDREIKIDYVEEHIWHNGFLAKEGAVQPRPAYPLYVKDDSAGCYRGSYEILEFKPDDWMRKLGILHSSIGKILQERKQEKEKKEALAKDPEVSENELKELEDRLGIKRRD